MEWVISDVHGCFYTLQKLIERIKNADSDAQFIFVGDYFDRGLFSKECVEYLIQLQSEGAVCLRGNHDNIIDYLINGQYYGSIDCEPEHVINWWMMNGLYMTLDSYGVKSHSEYAEQIVIQHEFVEKFPESHAKFVRDLKLYWENDTHFACHAYLPPTIDHIKEGFNPELFAEDILSRRFSKNFSSGTLEIAPPVWSKIGVFGHTPVSYYGAVAPINQYPNLRLIDTCALGDNYLCGYCCSSPDNWILQATIPQDIGGE